MARARSGARPARPARPVRQQPPSEPARNQPLPKRSWLDGPPPRLAGYPGDRLGLRETGRGSVASQGAKLGAFLLDLVVAGVLGFVAVRPHTPHDFQISNAVADGAFVLLTAALLATSGRTLGMRTLGLQVVRLDGRRMGWRALPRQILVGLLVPAIIVNRDRRGLHDLWLRTVVVNVS